MKILYATGIHLFSFAVAVAALFNEKARLLMQGRKSVWKQLEIFSWNDDVVWIHCASLGEFEQGRPIIEALKKKHPEKKILLTFFSPSGYEVRKNYDLVDLVTYLPADTPRNARRFIRTVNPETVVFVKYEFWPHFFSELQLHQIPLYSVSAIFREDQLFFKWYGKWFRKALSAVTKFYVQDEKSGQLLNSLNFSNYAVTGDTRFDRVAAIVESATDVPVAGQFSEAASTILVAGSTWPADEDILVRYINQAHEEVRLIIAPHEVHESRVEQLEQKLRVPSFRFTKKEGVDPAQYRVLIVDTIGLLSAVYRYGDVAYIGGGFGKGIHNTLEAATYAIPVLFGPAYHKFKEAHDLIRVGGGFSIDGYQSFFSVMEMMRLKNDVCKESGNSAGKYVESMRGATATIIEEVF